MKNNKIYLFDGTALIYRAYFAFIRAPLRNSLGENTSAIFGVANSCLKFFSQYKPEKMIVSFDLEEPTFRHQMTDTYKANRPPTPDELITQIEPVKEFFKLLNIPDISIEGYEADDVIATLAQRLRDEYEIVIVAGDKDFCQILDSKTVLYDPFNEKITRPEDVKKKYGITVEQFRDYLSLIGDSADNISGVKGIGPKGAKNLLNEYNTLETIYDRLDSISPSSLQEKLRQGRESAMLSKELVTLKKDVPLEDRFNILEIISGLGFNPTQYVNLIPYMKKYELNSLLRKLEESVKDNIENRSEQLSSVKTVATEEHSVSQEQQQTIEDLLTDDTNDKNDEYRSSIKQEVSQQSFDFFSEAFDYETVVIDGKETLTGFIDSLSNADIIAFDSVITNCTESTDSTEPDPLRLLSAARSYSKQGSSAQGGCWTGASRFHFSFSMGCAAQSTPSDLYNTVKVYYLFLDDKTVNLLNSIPYKGDSFSELSVLVTHDLKERYHHLQHLHTKLNNWGKPDDKSILSNILRLLSTLIAKRFDKAHSIQPERVKLFDTKIASYLLDAHIPQHSLPALVNREFRYQIQSKKEIEKALAGKSDQSNSGHIKPITEYISANTFFIFKLYEKQSRKMTTYAQLFYEVEMPLVIVLAKMESYGVYIDRQILDEINDVITEEVESLTAKIHKLAGVEFNINSTQQLSKILFEDLGLKSLKKTKSGYSTDNSVLEKLAEEYDIARYLIDYRQLTKLRSTYLEALPELINKNTNRIHTTFNQAVTATGRLSSSNPNLQNIPIRSKVGKHIRKAFLSEPAKSEMTGNRLILSADYSQIELRLLGIMSKDRNLVAAFNNRQDIHAQTAGLILGKPITTVTQDERRMAKTINFGIIYGMGAVKLSKEINVSQKEAKAFIDEYFRKFPKIKEFIQSLVHKGKQRGYAETIMGRRLYLPNIQNAGPKYQSEAERVAVNMPIQGSAADIIKIAMVRVDRELERLNKVYGQQDSAPILRDEENEVESFIARMIIQVHDELVFEVEEKYLDQVRQIVVREMKQALPEKYRMIIPLGIDTGVGKNWYEAHE